MKLLERGMWHFVGVGLGQSQDNTAIAVVERVEVRGEFDAAMYAYAKTIELRCVFWSVWR